MQKKRYEAKLHRLKGFYQFDVQALEGALVDVKLKKNKQIEQLSMRLNEIESIELNKQHDDHEVDALVKSCQEGLVLKSVKEARKVI